jgi:hypothetical protein
MKETKFEDIMCKYPELIEDGLILKGRQVMCYGRRMDILFDDKFGHKLIVELKIGPIKDMHIGQILSYEGMLLSSEDPTIWVMLIGNRVPPNIQRSLDHHGIAWKEISLSHIKEFIANKGDEEFKELFEEDIDAQRKQDIQEKKAAPRQSFVYKGEGESPAILAIVQEGWIRLAFDNYFSNDRDTLYFSTDSNGIKPAESLDIKHVYFKLKGKTYISLKADFVDFTEINPSEFRLPGSESGLAKYYYGFKMPTWLKNPLNLIDLKHFTSGKNVRPDIPGATIIADPWETSE